MAKVKNEITKGTVRKVTLICESNHASYWLSQPRHNERQCTGNLLLAASILFSGNTYQCIKEMMDIAKVSFFSKMTYYCTRKSFLFPAIHKDYSTHREIHCCHYVESNEHLDLTDHGRCDSLGYFAKDGTYTLMNITSNKIVDFHVVHSRQVSQVLIKLLDRFDKTGLKIKTLSTNRHDQIGKYIKDQRENIKRQFYARHASKSLKKNYASTCEKERCFITTTLDQVCYKSFLAVLCLVQW